MLSLRDCSTLDDCLQRLASLASHLRSDASRSNSDRHSTPWVRAIGARIESWHERRWPTIAELDHAVGDLPCLIMSFDHHAACANSAALRAASLHPGVSIPPNGVVCADPNGLPTGLLVEQAAYLAWDTAPKPSTHERTQHVLAALNDLASLGFAEVHDMHSQPWLGPILHHLDSQGLLPIDTVWLYPPVDEFPLVPLPWESDRIRIAGAKLFADGTLNSRTALMLHDYTDPFPGAPRGCAMLSPARIDAALRLLSDAPALDRRHARGHLAVHAIGDAAVRMVLDAIQRVAPRPDALGITARIEHCELIDEADIPRFASLGVVCSVQPCHLLYDAQALSRYLPHRLHRVLPLRDLIDAGCHPGMLTPAERHERRARSPSAYPSRSGGCAELWFGSDVPIVRANPDDSIQAAVYRRPAHAPEHDSIAPAQHISIDTAQRCFS